MTTASLKPANVMARLHLGCGESLSRLLPSEVLNARRPEQREQRMASGKARAGCKSGGGK
jgi:hypothetical protein